MLMIKLINDIRFGSIYYNQIRSNRTESDRRGGGASTPAVTVVSE